MTRSLGRTACAVALLCVAPAATSGQTPDTLKPPTLPPITVTVTRAERPLTRLPLAVQSLDRAQISRGKPTWGLDEALAVIEDLKPKRAYLTHLNHDIMHSRDSRLLPANVQFAYDGLEVC